MTRYRTKSRIHAPRGDPSVRLRDIVDAPASVSLGDSPLRLAPDVARRLVVITPQPPHRVLVGWGAVRAAHHARRDRVAARMLELDPVEVAPLGIAAEQGDLEGRIQIATLLRDHGLGDLDIAHALGINRADVSRLRKLASEPELRQALLEGAITFGHARYLFDLPTDVCRARIAKCQAEGWTVDTLAGVSQGDRPPPPRDPELDRQAALLSTRTNTTVAIDWVGKRGTLVLNWRTLPILQGLLEQLGRGYALEEGLPERERTLRIELDSLEEFQALIAPLVDRDD